MSVADNLSARLDTTVNIFLNDDTIRTRVIPCIEALCERKKEIYMELEMQAESHLQRAIDIFTQQEKMRMDKLKPKKLNIQPRDATDDPNILSAMDGLSRIQTVRAILEERIKHVARVKVNEDSEATQFFNEVRNSVRNVFMASNRRPLRVYLLKVLSSFLSKPSSLFKKFMNVALLGDPGSGKTYYANLLCAMFSALHFVIDAGTSVKEHTASDFIAQYAGQTGPKTLATLSRNLEKVMFIDEAYALTEGNGQSDEGGGASYGKEALTEIVNYLSTHVGQVIVVVAGYKKDMQEFLVSNPGLQRRFPNNLNLEPLTARQALAVLEVNFKILQDESTTIYELNENAKTLMITLYDTLMAYYKRHIEELSRTQPNFDRTKFVATTFFGNGAGSMVNLAGFFQEYIDLVDEPSPDAPPPIRSTRRPTKASRTANAHSPSQPVVKQITPNDVVCILAYSMTFGTSQQQRDWRLIEQVFKENGLPLDTCIVTFNTDEEEAQSDTSELYNQGLAEAASIGSSGSSTRSIRQESNNTLYYNAGLGTTNADPMNTGNVNTIASSSASSPYSPGPAMTDQADKTNREQVGGKPKRVQTVQTIKTITVPLSIPYDLLHDSPRSLRYLDAKPLLKRYSTYVIRLKMNGRAQELRFPITRGTGITPKEIIQSVSKKLKSIGIRSTRSIMLHRLAIKNNTITLQAMQVLSRCLA